MAAMLLCKGEPNSAGRVAVGDIKMYYQVWGRGEPLLMIMGLDHAKRVDKLVVGATSAGGRCRVFPAA